MGGEALRAFIACEWRAGVASGPNPQRDAQAEVYADPFRFPASAKNWMSPSWQPFRQPVAKSLAEVASLKMRSSISGAWIFRDTWSSAARKVAAVCRCTLVYLETWDSASVRSSE